MRILLTGATGFVGQGLMPRLVAAGHEVLAVTRGRAERAGEVRWDLAGGESQPPGLPSRIDAVIHAAQSRNYRAFPADAAEMFAVNSASTAMLLAYAARAGASRFCLLSTGTVYEPFDRGLDEDAAIAPASMLGASKLAAEVLARPYASLFPVAVLRIFTPYGPGQTGRLIPNLIERVRSGQAIQLSADGEGLRLAPVYIDDLSAIVTAAVEEGWAATINIASLQATTIREVAELIGRAVGREPRFEVGSGSATNLAPPVGRLGSLFDLGAMLPLDEGLARASGMSRGHGSVGPETAHHSDMMAGPTRSAAY